MRKNRIFIFIFLGWEIERLDNCYNLEHSRQLSYKKCHFDIPKTYLLFYFIILQYTIYHMLYSFILNIKIIYTTH